ncbi:MAG: hypothetical protein GOMPHAMPRED_003424 [Gomphillus americanus]|uniref:Uncharacterized protein n=1 Tax=Gomphillus americanus TaxID=1940652 RepID=A0A8H3FEC8_9LECA|nr:MAG: hypothetical protein GOMPHAMPRED_003424 [Gomphillus americanus]
MAKGTSKGSTRAKQKPAGPTSPTLPKTLKSGPPEPYKTPPPVLHTFLQTLNPKHIYITHIDKHSKTKKTQVWLLTASLNVLVSLIFLWRANYILPWYIQVLLSMWGYQSPLDVRGQSLSRMFNEVWLRSGTFALDFFLVRYGLTWPIDFFVGAASPLSWRWNVGFQDQEIAVRRSRKWEEQLGKNWLDGEKADTIHKEIIMPAIDRAWISAKTGYLMVDKNWDLDFRVMIDADALIKKGVNKIGDFEKTVFVYNETFGWLLWQVWKLDEGAESHGRQKVVELREKLTALGKEDLFFRWVEVIQFETSQPGGFTPERQVKAMQEARDLFKSNDVDFDIIWKEIGGGTAPDLST